MRRLPIEFSYPKVSAANFKNVTPVTSLTGTMWCTKTLTINGHAGQEPKTIGVPIPYIRPIFEAYVREYHHKIWPKLWY